MTNISPQDLLPENFAELKNNIPNFKTSALLRDKNPFKNFFEKLEENSENGVVFKFLCLLILAYLSMLVAVAFKQEHPSAVSMLLLLLLVYGAAWLFWRRSFFVSDCLAQILPLFKIYSIIGKNLKEAAPAKRQRKLSSCKKIKVVLFDVFFTVISFSRMKPVWTPQEKELLQIKQRINQIVFDRIIIAVCGFIFLIYYLNIAFILSDMGDAGYNLGNGLLEDLMLKGEELGPKFFITYLLLTIFALNFLLYGGNILIPYEHTALIHLAKYRPERKWMGYAWNGIQKAVIFIASLFFFIVFFEVSLSLYLTRSQSVNSIALLIMFFGFFFGFYFIYKICAFILIRTGLIMDRFYRN